MRRATELPDMNYIRRKIPIADVAKELGIRVAGRTAAHCWRSGHQNGDRTPSMSFSKRNRAKCYVCDVDSKSPIDLVIAYQECSLKEAVDWLCVRWTIPTIAKNTKLSRRERWATSPVGHSSFPLEQFIRSGLWAALDDAARAVLAVMFCFSEKSEVCISYRGLARFSGMKSDATIAKVLRQFKQLGIIESLPRSKNFRDVGRYRFTLDSEKFQTALSEVHARLKLESGAERELRAQMRSVPLPNSESEIRKALYPSTSVFSGCSTNQVHTSPSCSVNGKTDGVPNEEKEPFFEDADIDNKETCESSHYTSVKCEDEKPLDKKSKNIARACENAKEQNPISDGVHAEYKTGCTCAHFSTVKCEEIAPAEVTPLIPNQENENPPARWKVQEFSVLSESELAQKVARSIETARHWNEIATSGVD
jgi:hypothetical protein